MNNVQLPGLNLITATSFEIGPETLVRRHFYKLKLSVFILEMDNWGLE